MPDPQYIDVVEGDRGPIPAAAAAAHSENGRPAIRVYFKCAKAYLVVLRDVVGTGYCARCPNCGITKNFVVGKGGTNQRTFTLSCK